MAEWVCTGCRCRRSTVEEAGDGRWVRRCARCGLAFPEQVDRGRAPEATGGRSIVAVWAAGVPAVFVVYLVLVIVLGRSAGDCPDCGLAAGWAAIVALVAAVAVLGIWSLGCLIAAAVRRRAGAGRERWNVSQEPPSQ